MLDQDLKDAWLEASSELHIEIESKELLHQLEKHMTTLNKKIIARDRREIIASILGIIGFAALGYHIPFILSKVACGMAIIWCGFVIYRLKAARKLEQPNLSLSLSSQLSQRKEYLRQQSRMLKTVVYWYVIPPFLINALFFIGIKDPGDWHSVLSRFLPETNIEKIIILLLLVVFYSYIAWMNWNAAKKEYDPLIQEIDQTLRDHEAF